MTPAAGCGCCAPLVAQTPVAQSDPAPGKVGQSPAPPAEPKAGAAAQTGFSPTPPQVGVAPRVVPPPAPAVPSVAPRSTQQPAARSATPAPAGDVQLVSPQAGDAQLLAGVEQAMQASPTARLVLGKLQAGHARVQMISAAQMQQLSPGAQALYQSQDNTLYIPRESAAKMPKVVAVMVAHEGTHWAHDDLIDAAKAASTAGLKTAANPQAYGNEKLVENSLATEVEAHMVEARVGTELGLKTPAGHPALNADGTPASFAQTWANLEKDQQYNPQHVVTPPVFYRRVLPDDGSARQLQGAQVRT